MENGNIPTAVAEGVVIHNGNLIIDKKIIRSTVLLMKVWNDIFYKLNVSDKKYDINNILKTDKDLLHNLDFGNLTNTLKKCLTDLNINLILN
jgi:hypothetical protein